MIIGLSSEKVSECRNLFVPMSIRIEKYILSHLSKRHRLKYDVAGYIAFALRTLQRCNQERLIKERACAYFLKALVRFSVLVTHPKQRLTLKMVASCVNDGPAEAVASETSIGK